MHVFSGFCGFIFIEYQNSDPKQFSSKNLIKYFAGTPIKPWPRYVLDHITRKQMFASILFLLASCALVAEGNSSVTISASQLQSMNDQIASLLAQVATLQANITTLAAAQTTDLDVQKTALDDFKSEVETMNGFHNESYDTGCSL